MKNLLYLIPLLLAFACQPSAPTEEKAVESMSWTEIEAAAGGSTLNLMMWNGDTYINKYMRNYVVPTLKERHNITLNILSGQGTQIVQLLKNELLAGSTQSELDLMWINGETFYQLRQLNALHGPFTSQLPNAQYIDFNNPFIGTDFQQPVEGMECPWGNVQLCIIYDQARTPNPPQDLESLATWITENPGKFTIDTEFTGMTLLKSMMMALAGGPEALAGPFSEEKYQQYSGMLWEYLLPLKPYMWKGGSTFPKGVAQLHQMFVNGEIDITMSNNDGEVDNKIAQGLFPGTARAYALRSGTIQNSHYMGIARHSPNKAGAMVVANFLISPEAQLEKFNPLVWGDGTVLALEKLPAEWQEKFNTLPQRKFAPKREKIQPYALPELAPEYMIRIYNDFRTKMIGE